MLNPEESVVKATSHNFGCIYNAQGVHPDPNIVGAIHAMFLPESVTHTSGVLGIVIYLSPSIPSLLMHTATWQELMNKDINYLWNTSYHKAYDHVKLMAEVTQHHGTKIPVDIKEY